MGCTASKPPIDPPAYVVRDLPSEGVTTSAQLMLDPNLPIDVYLAQGLEFEPGDVRYKELIAFFHYHSVFTVGDLAQHEGRCHLLTDALTFMPARNFYDFRLMFKEFCSCG